MTQTTINRRSALAVVAAVPAAAALGSTALASVEEDAELRQLWDEYVAQLRTLQEIERAIKSARTVYDLEEPPCPAGVLPGDHWVACKGLQRKHGLTKLWPAQSREHRKLIRINKAIRKAKAESLFGIGVKLSASECFEEFDVVEAAEDARRSLATLTGVDFIAATGPLTDVEI